MKNFSKMTLAVSVFACVAIVACGKKDTKQAPNTDAPAKIEVLSVDCKSNILNLNYKKNNEYCSATAEYAAKALTKIKATFILSADGKPPVNPADPSNPSNPVNPSNPSNPVNPSNPSNPVNPSNPSSPANPSTPSNPSNPSGADMAKPAGTAISVQDKNIVMKVSVTIDKDFKITGIDGESEGAKLAYNNEADLKDAKVQVMYDKCLELVIQLKTASVKCESR